MIRYYYANASKQFHFILDGRCCIALAWPPHISYRRMRIIELPFIYMHMLKRRASAFIIHLHSLGKLRIVTPPVHIGAFSPDYFRYLVVCWYFDAGYCMPAPAPLYKVRGQWPSAQNFAHTRFSLLLFQNSFLFDVRPLQDAHTSRGHDTDDFTITSSYFRRPCQSRALTLYHYLFDLRASAFAMNTRFSTEDGLRFDDFISMLPYFYHVPRIYRSICRDAGHLKYA